MKEVMNWLKAQIKQERTLWLALGIVLLLMIVPGINAFPYPGNGQPYSDYATTHYPYAKFLIDSLKEFGEIPLWSNNIYSGMPFFANPQAGIWYPLYWIGYLFPLPMGFTVVVAVHLILGMIGMKKFLMQLEITGIPALIGSAAFLLMPKLWAHFGAGHLTLFCAVMWMPWLLYLSRPKKRKWYLAWSQPGLVLAMIFLVASQWALYAGLLWATQVIFNRAGKLWERLLYLVWQGVLALLLAMPLWLPMLEFVGHSSRQSLDVADRLYLSLPWSNLIGLVLPAWNPSHEWAIYPGMAVVVLAVATLLTKETIRKHWFWWVVIILTGTFALGENLLWNTSIVQIPGFSLLRVPTRGLFLAGFALAVLSAYGFQYLISSQFKRGYAFRLVSMTILSTAMVLSAAIMFLGEADFIEIAITIGLLITIIIWLLLKDKLSQYWAYGILILLVIELVFSSTSMYRFRSVDDVFAVGEAAAQFISQDDSTFRVYSPSYSIPEQTAVRYGIELADGNDPMQLQDYVWFMEVASGIPVTKYAPTIPAFEEGDPKTANQDYLPDLEQLGRINVKYIASAFPIYIPYLYSHGKYDGVYVYENLYAMPRAYVENEGEFREADIISQAPNTIEINAEGPGELLLAEVNYPGWQVSIDGIEAAFENYLVKKVILDEGDHLIKMEFKPLTLKYGIIGGIVGLVVLISLMLLAYGELQRERNGKV